MASLLLIEVFGRWFILIYVIILFSKYIFYWVDSVILQKRVHFYCLKGTEKKWTKIKKKTRKKKKEAFLLNNFCVTIAFCFWDFVKKKILIPLVCKLNNLVWNFNLLTFQVWERKESC